jgi:hypothetical protein
MKATRPDQRSEEESPTPEQEAIAKAVGAWVHQLARTLKTLRLYETSNPTVVKFRQELFVAVTRLLDDQGVVQLTFTADDVTCEGVSLYPAKSRDDNLAFAFYRDGIRSITLSPGLQSRELDAILDCVVLVTGQNSEQNDLVTSLWEAHLPHLEIDYVPGESDLGGGGGGEGEAVLWPTGAGMEEGAEESAPATDTQAVHADLSAENAENTARSDDWSVGEFTMEIEAAFEELQTLAPAEIERFRAEYEAEHRLSLVARAIAVIRAYLVCDITSEDREEVHRFLPRVLRQAFVEGQWSAAGEVLSMLDGGSAAGKPEWSMETFAQELLQPRSS